MILYKTILKEAVCEQTIEKSRFIAYAKPVSTKEEADAFVAEIKGRHKDATHNVPAMVIGDRFQLQWGSDDGEPQGTSGAPIVQMLVKEGLTNLVIVVTRYFGGIKLGTGGLVRAYTGSAKLVLEEAVVCEVKEARIFEIKLDYTYLAKLQNMAANGKMAITDIFYEDMVRARISCDSTDAEDVRSLLANLTGGKVVYLTDTVSPVKVPLKRQE
ncbi:MAG: YigZ family protein [Clostridia bacterium]|nr:YigZ family protein [Clostridia bacterium]